MALASTLHIAVACEGVETTEQAQLLGKAGAKPPQGGFFAKLMPLTEIVRIAGVSLVATASV